MVEVKTKQNVNKMNNNNNNRRQSSSAVVRYEMWDESQDEAINVEINLCCMVHYVCWNALNWCYFIIHQSILCYLHCATTAAILTVQLYNNK